MERFLIPGFTPGDTKTVLEMVDCFYNRASDFVGGIPFIRTADGTRVGAQIFLGINVKHSAAGGFRTGIIAKADTLTFTGFFIIYPFHFGTCELHGRESTEQMGFASFPFHRQEKILRTAGNAIFIERTVVFRKGNPSGKRDICFFKGSFPEQIFIDFNGVKSRIPQKCSRVDKGMFPKKNFSTGMRALEAARLLSSSGESVFSNHDIRVSIQKVFVIKADISDNAKPVCHDAEFKGIVKCPLMYICWMAGLAAACEDMGP